MYSSDLRLWVVMQETWCSSTCEWLWLGAQWPARHDTGGKGRGSFYFNFTWWIVSKCLMMNETLAIMRFLKFGIVALFEHWRCIIETYRVKWRIYYFINPLIVLPYILFMYFWVNTYYNTPTTFKQQVWKNSIFLLA